MIVKPLKVGDFIKIRGGNIYKYTHIVKITDINPVDICTLHWEDPIKNWKGIAHSYQRMNKYETIIFKLENGL